MLDHALTTALCYSSCVPGYTGLSSRIQSDDSSYVPGTRGLVLELKATTAASMMADLHGNGVLSLEAKDGQN